MQSKEPIRIIRAHNLGTCKLSVGSRQQFGMTLWPNLISLQICCEDDATEGRRAMKYRVPSIQIKSACRPSHGYILPHSRRPLKRSWPLKQCTCNVNQFFDISI